MAHIRSYLRYDISWFIYQCRKIESGQTLTAKESWFMDSKSWSMNHTVWFILYSYNMIQTSLFDLISIKISLRVCFSTVQMTSSWMDHMKYLTPVGICQIWAVNLRSSDNFILHFWSEVHMNFEIKSIFKAMKKCTRKWCWSCSEHYSLVKYYYLCGERSIQEVII